MKVIATNIPATDEELRLELNDIVEFIGEEDDGRLRGRLNGKVGTFPSNCVKFIDPLVVSRLVGCDGAAADTALSAANAAEGRGNGAERGENSSTIAAVAATSVIQPKKVVGVGFGNIFAGCDGKIGLKSARAVAEERKTTDDAAVKPSVQASFKKQEWLAGSVMNPPVKEVRKELVRANYAYAAENDDELSFKAGDIITVLSKESEDAGWWLGELNGRRGVFPDNFVAPYVAEDGSHPKSQPPVVPMKPTKPCPTVPPPPPSSADSPASAVVNKAPLANTSVLTHHSTTRLTSAAVETSERKSDNVATDDSETASSHTVPSVTEKLDRLGAFRFPIFSKPKSTAPKPVDSAASESAETKLEHQEKAKGELQEHELSNDGAEKLSHLTAARPKMKKRPPSQAFLRGMADGSQNGFVKTLRTVPAEVDDGESTGTMPSSAGQLIPEEFEVLRQAFAEFKSKVLSDIKELEKRFAAVEALIVTKRPHCTSSSS